MPRALMSRSSGSSRVPRFHRVEDSFAIEESQGPGAAGVAHRAAAGRVGVGGESLAVVGGGVGDGRERVSATTF